MAQIKSLQHLLALAVENPSLGKHLKNDPNSIASIFDVRLTDEQAQKIAENLDIEQLSKSAVTVDSMAAKVAQGVGLK